MQPEAASGRSFALSGEIQTVNTRDSRLEKIQFRHHLPNPGRAAKPMDFVFAR